MLNTGPAVKLVSAGQGRLEKGMPGMAQLIDRVVRESRWAELKVQS